MADTISNVGRGIAFTGEAKDYSSLIGQGLSLRAKRREKEKEDFAKLTDFDLTKIKNLYPYYSNKILKAHKDFVNEFEKEWRKDPVAARHNAIQRKAELDILDQQTIQDNTKTAEQLGAAAKGLIAYGTEELSKMVQNPNTTDEEWIALNKPGFGVVSGAGGRFLGTQWKQEDLDKIFNQGGYERMPAGVPEKIDLPGMGTLKQLNQRLEYTPDQILNYASRIKENPDALRTFVLSNEQEFKKKVPDIFSDDEQKRNAAIDTALLDFASKRMTPKVVPSYHNIGFAPQGSAAERNKQPTTGAPLTIPIEGGNPATYPIAWGITEIINAPNSETFDLKTRVKAKGLPATFQMNTSNIGIAQTKKANGQLDEPKLVVLGKAQEFAEKDKEQAKNQLWRDAILKGEGAMIGGIVNFQDEQAKKYEPDDEQITNYLISTGKQVKERDVQVPFNDVKGSLKSKGIPVDYYEKQLDEYKKQHPTSRAATQKSAARKYSATNPENGLKIFSDDGITWYDEKGKLIP